MKTILETKNEKKSLEETLHLYSIPGLVENINDIRNNENWDDALEYDANEEW